jgi:hypothetical protein
MRSGDMLGASYRTSASIDVPVAATPGRFEISGIFGEPATVAEQTCPISKVLATTTLDAALTS